MTLEDIVEVINRYIEEKRHYGNLGHITSHLVLHKSITPAPLVKAYKVYDYILWLVDSTKMYRVLTVKHQSRVLAGMEEEFTKGFEKSFLENLLKLIIDGKSTTSDKTILEEIINGRYTGYYDE